MDRLFPPSPNFRIFPKMLDAYEEMGDWIAQRKYNGQRNLIQIKPDKTVKLFNRYGKGHAGFELSTNLEKQILSLNLEDGKEYWIDSELMNDKTKNLKNTIILFDVLFAGDYLLGVNQLDRLRILSNICGGENELTLDPLGIAYVICPNIWLAPFFDKNFAARYQEFIHLDEIEGLLLRRKDGCIDNLGQKEYEVSWMIRCRKEHKNYDF